MTIYLPQSSFRSDHVFKTLGTLVSIFAILTLSNFGAVNVLAVSPAELDAEAEPLPGVIGVDPVIARLTIGSAKADPSVFKDSTRVSATFNHNIGPFTLEYATVKLTKLSVTSPTYNMACVSGCGTASQVWQTGVIDTSNSGVYSDGQWTVTVAAKVQGCATIFCVPSTTFMVTIDKTAPEGKVIINGDDQYTNNKVVALAVTCDDKGGSGCASTVDYQTDSTSGSGSVSNSITGVSIAETQGSHEVRVTLRDVLGNSRIVSDNIVFDSIAPEVTPKIPQANAAGWYSRPVPVEWQGVDSGGSGIADCTDETYAGPDGASITLTGECTDNAGNVGKGEAKIKYDETPPQLKVPDDISVTAAGQSGGSATFEVSATDSLSGLAGDATCDRSSGSIFPVGKTTVRCSVNDVAGNVAKESFDVAVTINDTNPPVIKIPSDLVTKDATGSSGIVVDYEVTANDDVDGPVDVSCNPGSGSVFNVGETTVKCTAKDEAGNPASAEFKVKVNAPGAPTVVVPKEPVELVAPDSNGIAVDFADKVSATDALGAPLTATCTPASGSTFVPGETTVKCKATNSAGISGESTFLVIVSTTAPAKVSIAADTDKFIAGQDNIKVRGKVSGGIIGGGSVQISIHDRVGTLFASETAGLQNDGSFALTITKQIPLDGVAYGEWKVVAMYSDFSSEPSTFKVLKKGITQLKVPSSPIVIEAKGDNGALVNYADQVSASDSEEGTLMPICSPASGTPFTVGETIVKCSVTTLAGTTVEKQFPVTVQTTSRPSLDPMTLGIIGAVAAAAVIGGVVAFTKMRKKRADMDIP